MVFHFLLLQVVVVNLYMLRTIHVTNDYLIQNNISSVVLVITTDVHITLTNLTHDIVHVIVWSMDFDGILIKHATLFPHVVVMVKPVIAYRCADDHQQS